MDEASIQAMTSDVLGAYAAIEARVARGEPRGHGNEAFAALTKLLVALGLDRDSHPAPLEQTTLPETQRSVLVTLVEHHVPLRGATSLSLSWWRQRRWLGLADPGLLERLWPATRPTDLDAAVSALPEAQQVEAGIEVLLADRPLGPWFFDALPSLASHALDYARATLPLLPISAPVLVRVGLFSAFAASDAELPEELDLRFPLSYRLPGEPLANRVSTRWLVPHLAAVAPARRDEVLVSAMRRIDGGNAHAALHLLEHEAELGPLPRALDALAAHLDRAKTARITTQEKKTNGELARRLKALSKSAAKASKSAAKASKSAAKPSKRAR